MKNLKRVLAVVLTALLVLTLFAGCTPSPEKQILGSWRDSTGTTGYEFKEGNECIITYADVTVPIVNIKYDGSVPGTYTVSQSEDGATNYVTITYTILAKSITKIYTFAVDGNALSMTDTEDGRTVIYMAYTEPTAETTETTAAPVAAQ